MNLATLKMSLGKHWIIECYDCDSQILNNPTALEKTFVKAARDAGATVLSAHFHEFLPQGISGVVIIAESHITVHTWPEHNYAAVDIFTCGSRIDIQKAHNIIKEGLASNDSRLTMDIDRGILNRDQFEKPAPIENSIRTSQDWKELFAQKNAWGILTSVDVHKCNPEIIRDADAIKDYTLKICDLIEMKRFGETVVVNFGEDERVAGFSLVQLIETSLISGHFANQSNNAFIDIFSCKYYDPQVAAEFSLNYFKGKDYTMNIAIRK